ncbi:MAG: FAD-binding oxidoreductase [Pleomorphochaeta sp.]
MIKDYEEKYREYLSDESKLIGSAKSISFPKNTDEIIKILKTNKDKNVSITIQGARSGIVGGAVPNNNHILNTQKLTKIEKISENEIFVESGVTLDTINSFIERNNNDYFFAVDPTEKTATIGGVIANNSKGPNSHYYGDPSKYIEEITVIYSDLTVETLTKTDKKFFTFFGSEGIFGLIISARIKLIKKPEISWGISFFFNTINDVCGFSNELKTIKPINTAKIVAAEFMEKSIIELIEPFKETMSNIKAIPSIPKGNNHLIYVEIHSDSENDFELIVELLIDLAMKYNSDVDNAWAVSEAKDLENIRNYRHAAAECTNMILETRRKDIPNINKVSLDISIKEDFETTLNRFNKIDIDKVIFGHIFSSNIHLNFLPKTINEFEKAKIIAKLISLNAINNNGIIISEHGVGKVKKDIFLGSSKTEDIEKIVTTKKILDKINLFNPNNII